MSPFHHSPPPPDPRGRIIDWNLCMCRYPDQDFHETYCVLFLSYPLLTGLLDMAGKFVESFDWDVNGEW